VLTDILNIPINIERAKLADQVLSLAEMSWIDYEELTETKEYSGYRISYWHGEITIVSPSKNHERIAEIISGLIKTFCRQQNLAYFPLGSTTLKKPPLAGKEAVEARVDERRKGMSTKTPDHSFAFGTDKPLPDLAIEVTYTSGSSADLEKYKYLGIEEVWFWKNKEITFYRLIDGEYELVESSICLPQLEASFIISFINRGLTETPLTIEADFYQQLD